MDAEIRYTLTPGNGRPIKVGSAKVIVEHLTSIDESLSGLHLTKKPRVYWKGGLSDKAAKV